MRQGVAAATQFPGWRPDSTKWDWKPSNRVTAAANLAGHKTPAFVLWLFAHGVMPLYTPFSGSWLNMSDSIQRVLKRRALPG